MQTVGELKLLADQKLFDEAYDEALRLYSQLVELQPLNLDARLRVADTLMAKGEVQRAAVVYTRLAQYAAHAGHPLRALIAVKILAALEPQLAQLLSAIGALYGRDSEKLGRGVRRSLPSPSDPLPAEFEPDSQPPPGESPVERAERLASDFRHQDALLPERLMPLPLLSLLTADEFAAVIASIGLVRARPGTVIIEQGAAGRSFFVLARGSVQVSRAEPDGTSRILATFHDGAIFGEMALLSSAPRSATVTALSDADLLEFDRDALAHASQTAANLERALSAFARERLLSNVMGTAALFRPLDRKQRQDLMRRFVAADIAPGAAVIQQGDPGQGVHVVLRGEVAVQRSEEGRTVELARLGPGELFGEMSLLDGAPTNASVVATEPTGVLFLGRDYFLRLIEAVPEIRAHLEQLSEEREMDMRISMAPDLDGGPTLDDDSDDSDDDDEIEVDVMI